MSPIWTKARLNDVCRTTSGGTPSRNVRAYYEGGTVPWIKSGELKDGPIHVAEESITKLAIKNSSAKKFPAGTLLIALYGATVGRLGVLQINAATNQAICALFPEKSIDRDYLFYYLLGQRANLIKNRTGGAQPNISQETIRNLEIPLPPLAEQQRIAGILGRADRLRRLRRYALALSEGYLQAVFLEMFGGPVTNPMGWEVGKLDALCSKIVDCPHSTPKYASIETEYLCVRSSDIQNGYFDWSTTKHVTLEEYQERVRRYVPQNNDIVYCREGARFGNAARIPSGVKVCLGQRMMLFKVNPKVTTHEFVWALLESDSIYSQADRLSGGSASPHVNVGDIKKFDVIIPPIRNQKRFAKMVAKQEVVRNQQSEALRQAEHLFQALLQRAFYFR